VYSTVGRSYLVEVTEAAAACSSEENLSQYFDYKKRLTSRGRVIREPLLSYLFII
jgi:hypothetical protein